MKKKEWIQRLGDLYLAAGGNKRDPHRARIEETRSQVRVLFWVWSSMCVIEAVILVYIQKRWDFSHSPDSVPLFSGPPEFIMLAIIVALSVYMRSVRSEAIKMRGDIHDGDKWSQSLNAAHRIYTEIRLKHLDMMVEKLSIAGPFVMWLLLVLGMRIVADTLLRFGAKERTWNEALFIGDVVIAGWIATAFVGLLAAHRAAKDRDDDLRAITQYCLEKTDLESPPS